MILQLAESPTSAAQLPQASSFQVQDSQHPEPRWRTRSGPSTINNELQSPCIIRRAIERGAMPRSIRSYMRRAQRPTHAVPRYLLPDSHGIYLRHFACTLLARSASFKFLFNLGSVVRLEPNPHFIKRAILSSSARAYVLRLQEAAVTFYPYIPHITTLARKQTVSMGNQGNADILGSPLLETAFYEYLQRLTMEGTKSVSSDHVDLQVPCLGSSPST